MLTVLLTVAPACAMTDVQEPIVGADKPREKSSLEKEMETLLAGTAGEFATNQWFRLRLSPLVGSLWQGS